MNHNSNHKIFSMEEALGDLLIKDPHFADVEMDSGKLGNWNE